MELPAVDTLPVVYEGTVGEQHIDRFRHVNVMWYTHFFDEATLGLFEELGCGPSYYRDSGHGMFALEQHTRYLGELRLGDRLEARARLLSASTKRVHFLLFLVVGGARLSATSELVGLHVELESRRSAPFPSSVHHRVERMLAAHRALTWTAPSCGVMGA